MKSSCCVDSRTIGFSIFLSQVVLIEVIVVFEFAFLVNWGELIFKLFNVFQMIY